MIAHPDSIRWSAAIEFIGRRRGKVVESARGDDRHFAANGVTGLRRGRRNNWRRVTVESDADCVGAKDVIRFARR